VLVVGWGSSEHRQECLCHLRRSSLRWPRLKLGGLSDGEESQAAGRIIKVRFVTIRNLEVIVFAGFSGNSNRGVTIRNPSLVRQLRGG